MSRWINFTFTLIFCAALSSWVEAAALYTIQDLGTLPGTTESIATGINDQGQVVGYANNPTDGGLYPQANPRSFLFSNGQMTPISPIGGGAASAINDSGQVVGGIYNSINDSGQYVAGATDYGQGNPVLVSGGTTAPLGHFDPVAINDSGLIAGYVTNTSNGFDPAIYKNGQVIDLAKTLGLDTLSGQVIAINNAGDVFFYYLNLKNNDVPIYLILRADGQIVGANSTTGLTRNR